MPDSCRQPAQVTSKAVASEVGYALAWPPPSEAHCAPLRGFWSFYIFGEHWPRRALCIGEAGGAGGSACLLQGSLSIHARIPQTIAAFPSR
jgi:hypothetical protein